MVIIHNFVIYPGLEPKILKHSSLLILFLPNKMHIDFLDQ